MSLEHLMDPEVSGPCRFHHAWHHSPQLRNVPERPRDTRENAIDELGPGLGAL